MPRWRVGAARCEDHPRGRTDRTWQLMGGDRERPGPFLRTRKSPGTGLPTADGLLETMTSPSCHERRLLMWLVRSLALFLITKKNLGPWGFTSRIHSDFVKGTNWQ